MFFIKNKKGADKMLSMYWFAIIIIVSVGVVAMVYIFYTAPYEVRDAESEVLSNQFANCFSRGGLVNPMLASVGEFNSGFDLLGECEVNFVVENEYGWSQREQFFVETEFYSVDDLNNPKLVLSEGNLDWKPSCFIKDKKDEDYDRLVKCNEERIYVLGEDGEQYLIKILVGVGKIDKNVRQ